MRQESDSNIHLFILKRVQNEREQRPQPPPHPFAPSLRYTRPLWEEVLLKVQTEYKNTCHSTKVRTEVTSAPRRLPAALRFLCLWAGLMFESHCIITWCFCWRRLEKGSSAERWSWSRGNVLSPEGVHMCVKPARKWNSMHCEGCADTQRRSQTDRNRVHIVTL